MNEALKIEKAISGQKKQLRNHPIYTHLKTLDHIKIFMEAHVFAVWDFMSLLKALQRELTCISLPWTPAKNSTTAHLINEIVCGEESDVNEQGVIKSHFEMYIDAMSQIGAKTDQITNFIGKIETIPQVTSVLSETNLDMRIKNFVAYTFEVISSNKVHCIAAAFTYGREDIIPEMFIEILKHTDAENTQYNKLMYYLKRHVEIDADKHGPLALNMISELCGNDKQKWKEALEVAKICVEKRTQLWDAINDQIKLQDKSLILK